MENPFNTQKMYNELTIEIRSFIEGKKEPSKLIKGHVSKINTLEKSIKVELSNESNFYKGAFVIVDHEVGSVIDSYGSTVKIQFKKNPSKFEDTDIVIDARYMNIVLDRLEKTINKIEEEELEPYNRKILNFVIGVGKPQYIEKNVKFISKTLNLSQKEAVSKAIQAEDFHLIIGPPGTGKTYVINEIIRQFVISGQKILVTAGTNVAVDNIIEKLPELEEKILRIGSDISPVNLKYSLKEQRKRHEDWVEVQKLDKIIEDKFETIKKFKEENKQIQKGIDELKNRKNEYEEALSNILKVKDQYLKKAESYNHDLNYNNNKFIELKNRKEFLEKRAEIHYTISKDISKLNLVKLSLPDTEVFYDLESSIKSMQNKKFSKKITSIFNKKSYKQFSDELDEKEAVYNEMVNSYNDYWDLHDLTREKYDEIYPDGNGNLDQDLLDMEIELFRQLDEFIPLKNMDMRFELLKVKEKIISEAYKHYITNLDNKAGLLRAEIKDYGTIMHFKINERQKLSRKINNLQESIDKYKADKKILIEYIDAEIIEKAEIIAATVISSLNPILDDIQFDYMIMDEASQVASFMSLIPLLKCKKFILVGDNKQLQPIGESKLSRELNLSIFNRLVIKYPDSSTFLDTQYRMNRKIADMASKLFYDGKLKTFDEIADQCLECEINSDIMDFKTPLTFIDTANLDYHEEGIGSGCENAKEAQLVVKITDDFLKNGINPKEIGIITPYKKHKTSIMNHLNNKKVEVDTVYRFQGREKDVIIMSFCNSKIGKLGRFIKGFIEQPTQVNVALTRAKKKFIMVGNSKTLKQSELLDEVMEIMGK